MRDLLLDWRQAIRSFRHSRSFVAVALLTLTFGIGLSTAVFSLVRGILLSPLDIPESGRLVRLGETTPARRTMFNGMINEGADRGPSLADTTVGVWIEHPRTLQAIAPMNAGDANVAVSGETVRVSLADVGGQFFEVFPVTPQRGRLLARSDDVATAPAVIAVSDRFWAQRFNRRDDAVGATVTIEGTPAVIVGVLPAGFEMPDRSVDIWRPSKLRYPPPGRARNLFMSMSVVGRLRPGMTPADVRTEGQQILTTIAQANPAFFDGTVDVPVVIVEPLLDAIVGPVKPALELLLAGMACVLLAACVNLASLVLSRNTAREHDIAVRQALGASGWRLVRPLLVEQLLLGACGAASGGLAAWWLVRLLPRIAPADLPRLDNVRFDLGALAFAAATGIATALLVGILPARRIRLPRLRAYIGSQQAAAFGEGRRGDLARSVLVGCQIALATVLLVGAALIGRSLAALVRVDPGYRPQGVLTFQIGFPDLLWREKGRETAFFRELHARLLAHPGVTAAGHTTSLPFRAGGNAATFPIEGRPVADRSEWPRGRREGVTHGYLEAIGARIVRGRGFTDRDTAESEPVVVVNEVFADRFFRSEDPIGHRLQVRARAFARIVGIVSAAHIGALSADAPPTVLELADQVPEIIGYVGTGAGVALRVDGDPDSFGSIVRAEVRSLEPGFPVFNIEPLQSQLDQTFAQPRFYTVALLLFAGLAISTAVLGLYGVLAYAVERRRFEFGIRRALGADARHIVLLVTRRAALLGLLGLGAGMGGASAASRLLRSVLFGVQPSDPASYVSAVIVIGMVVVVASWYPVHRALGIDPARALRVE